MSIASKIQRIQGNIENTYTTIAEGYPDALPAEENSDNLSDTVSSALSAAYDEGEHASDSYQTGYDDGYSDGYDDGYADGQGGDPDPEPDPDPGDLYEEGYQDGYDVGYSDGYTDGSESVTPGSELSKTLAAVWDASNYNDYAGPVDAECMASLSEYFLENNIEVMTLNTDGKLPYGVVWAVVHINGIGTVVRPMAWGVDPDSGDNILIDTDSHTDLYALDGDETYLLMLTSLRIDKITAEALEMHGQAVWTRVTTETDLDEDWIAAITEGEPGELLEPTQISGDLINSSGTVISSYSGSIFLYRVTQG